MGASPLQRASVVLAQWLHNADLWWRSGTNFTGKAVHNITADRTWTFQNRDGTIADDTDLALKADAADLTSHTGNTSNPHSVTASQVGLGNVNNTSDADKPVSTATQAALDDKADAVDNVVQRVFNSFATVDTGSTLMVQDNTIPQNVEGDEYCTLSITPTSVTNRLRIRAKFHVSSSVTNNIIMALFQDSTANALDASWISLPSDNSYATLILEYTMVAGTTSATTFKIRIGGVLAGTTTINGFSSAQKLGGTLLSTLEILEEAV